MTKRATILPALLTAVAFTAAAEEPKKPPNILLITIESLRTDHLASFEGPRTTSPSLDALAGEATVYTDTHSVTSWTLASHASLFTGLYPTAHQTDLPLSTLDDSYTTLAEVLRGAGYQTAGVVSGPYLRAGHNLDQGFEIYDDSPSSQTNAAAHDDVTNPAMEARLRRFLDGERDPERPFFLFAYFWDPHYDYIPPPPYDTMFVDETCRTIDLRNYELTTTVNPRISPPELRHVLAQYDGEIRWTDDHLGRLFQALRESGLWDQTAIVVTSDHGEEFFDHGHKGHKNNLYVENVKVPLFVKYPKGGPRGRDPRLVSLVDVYPTLLELAGAELPDLLQGRSLLAAAPTEPRSIFFELRTTRYEGNSVASQQVWLAVRRGDRKLIATPGRIELYDTVSDPRETRDLAAAEPATVGKLKRQLFDWREANRAIARRYREGPQAELSDEELDRLRALGYID